MLPERLLNFRRHGDQIVPRFIGADDLPWLRSLVDQAERYSGRREGELEERLHEPLGCGVDARKQRLAALIIRRAVERSKPSTISPREARAALFGTAASSDAARQDVVTEVAEQLSVTTPALEEALFADLPGQRIVVLPPGRISPSELALRVNLALAQGLIARAKVVSIELEGNARAIVRQANLRRLICGVRSSGPEGAILDISGPFALFRHTLVYGRALGELLPLLAWCRRFRLEASCTLQERSGRLVLASGDPIFPAAEPRRYDSKVEARFARDLSRLSTVWDLIREPQPIQAGPRLLFPDFALQHRQQPHRRWLVEIVGYWTDRYLERKLEAYRAAGIQDLILCIDDHLACQDSELPSAAHVLRYHRSVDAEAVLRIVEACPPVPAWR